MAVAVEISWAALKSGVPEGRRVRGLGERGEGVKKNKLVVTK